MADVDQSPSIPKVSADGIARGLLPTPDALPCLGRILALPRITDGPMRHSDQS